MDREPRAVDRPERAPAPDSSVDRVRPFHIHVEQPVLDDLQTRLAHTRWARVSAPLGWRSGTDPAYLRALVDHWRGGYDWRRHEARLDEPAQFIARVDGSELHFVHVKAGRPGAVPLLLLHGWPDSFDRFHKVIPALTGPDAPHDVVVPSLPGFAFTPAIRPAPREQPMRRTAELLWKLMTELLGYPRFGVAGGDDGGAIAQILAIDHPESILGVHLTDLGAHAARVDPSSVSRAERCYLARLHARQKADGAYAMVQASRPRSLAVGLTDSPVGLASWIVDRFHAGSDGDLEARFGKDDLLTNIMLYWVTGSIASSMLPHHGEARAPSLTPADRVERPVGLALFPHDLGGIPPRSLAERTLDVRRWTEMPRGGRFAALDEPELFARDVIAFFASLRSHRD